MNKKEVNMYEHSFANGLCPRCIVSNLLPIATAEGLLMPCAFTHTDKNFNIWAENNNLNYQQDLAIDGRSYQEIQQTPTMKRLHESFVTGDAPATCWKDCADNSYESINGKSKWKNFNGE